MVANLINYPTGISTTINTTVKLRALPPGTRILPTYIITVATPAAQTVTTTAAAIAGATTLAVAPLTVPIRAGISLDFAGVTVTVTRQAKAGDTALYISAISGPIASAAAATYTPAANAIGNTLLSVSPTLTFLDAGEVLTFGATKVILTDQAPVNSTLLQTTPLAAAVTPAATAATRALLTLVGATDASPSSTPKTTDATNYLSGAGVEMATVGTNHTLTVTFNEIEGDLGAIVIKQLLLNNAYYKREIYAVVARPNGEIYEGAAIVTQGDMQSPMQDKITRSSNFQFQGSSFLYTPPTNDSMLVAALMA